MKSFINTLFDTRDLEQHDGRTLWKYNLSDEEYNELKTHLSEIDENEFDQLDIALYYAEWWKNEYNGGLPTKIAVYNSIFNCNLSFDEFYKYAKRGAVRLGIKWIQRENKLYFRTLLLQGGLPINHLLNNSGTYTNFLKKVLEINPSTIDEFAYEDDIICILPYSSRNEAIYESCLQIVRSIINGNDEYIGIFENRKTAKLKEIFDELKKHREIIEKTAKKRSKFRAYWILNKALRDKNIKLQFNFPDIIEKDDFAELTQTHELNLKTEYNLIINDLLLCKFKKNIKGNYKIFWFNNSNIFWDEEETKPEIYLSSIDGERCDFPILMIDNPKTSEPTLWTQKTEFEWILNKGKYCKKENAAVLFLKEWSVLDRNDIEQIEINQQKLSWIEFYGELELSNCGEIVIFKTNMLSFDWFLKEDKPQWIIKSNIPIVTRSPQIVVYDKSGERINRTDLFWRLHGDLNWNKWSNINFPVGCIEYKIIANGCEETDYFYNIGSFDLDFISDDNNPEKVRILIEQNNILSLEIRNNEMFEFERTNDEIKLKLYDLQKTPKSISATINRPNQKRSLYLEIIPPFFGVKIIDKNGNILTNNSILLFGHFNGYRIISPIQKNNYFIKFYNSQKPEINIIKGIYHSKEPLREYEELALRLFRLTDTMDKNSSVTIELIDNHDKIISNYIIKNYNKILRYNYENDRLEININNQNIDIDLFAIPLDCSAGNIELISLNKTDNEFTFPETVFCVLEKFIVISELNNNSSSMLLPCFVSRDKDNLSTTIDDRQRRIRNNKERLISQNSKQDSWIRVLTYYKICVNNEIPFSTFDIFRAAASNPELSAKLFCFLSIYNDNANFIDSICKELEEDLGFCFHWISKTHWFTAIDWIKESFNFSENSEELQLIRESILEMISNSEPIGYFDKIADYITKNKLHQSNGFHLNTEILTLRQALGEKVLNELPVVCPQIQEENKHILPVTKETALVKILLKVPLAVALSITGKDESIWSNKEEFETIRRNIQYCQWIAPDWYGKAILYCLNKLQN